MKKKLAAKLADSLRQARQAPAEAEPAPTASAPPRSESPAAPAPSRPPAAQPAPAPPARQAVQKNQSPSARLERPWDGQHSSRIWPD